MDQLRHIYDDLLGHIQRVATHTDRNSRDIHDLIAQSHLRDQLENAIKIYTALYSSARAYTNVVILAGYAAFFAVWSFLRSDIPYHASLWALFLMMISAAVFVAFEVGKMIWTSVAIRRVAKGFYSDEPLSAFENIKKNEQREAVIVGRIWVFALMGSILPGFTAFAVLIINLVEVLLRTPNAVQ